MSKTSFKSETTLTGETEAKEGKDTFLNLGRGSKGARAFCGSLSLKVGKSLKEGSERDSSVDPNIGPSLKLRTEMGLEDM